MPEITLKIEGMSCQHCVMGVKKALDSTEGVTSSDVEVGSAKVTYDDASTNLDALGQAIQGAGFRVVS